MRAALQSNPSVEGHTVERNSSFAVFSEVLAELAERVELLETRERLARTRILRRKEGAAKARE